MAVGRTRDHRRANVKDDPIDPTFNTADLVRSSDRRHDDIRAVLVKAHENLIRHVATVSKLRADHGENLAKMRATHAGEIRLLDVERQQATRQIDILNAASDASRAGEAIKTLATQTNAIDEKGRLAVANTASALAEQLTQLFSESNKRLSALELTSANTGGKGAGIGLAWSVLIAVVLLLGGLFALSERWTPSPVPVQERVQEPRWSPGWTMPPQAPR